MHKPFLPKVIQKAFPISRTLPGELIVRLHSDASVAALDKLSKRLGAVSISPIFSPATPAGQHPRLKNIYLIRFPTQWALTPLLQRYEQHPSIAAVELNRLSQLCAGTVPNDPSYTEQWNLRLIDMPEAWGIEHGDPQVIVRCCGQWYSNTAS